MSVYESPAYGRDARFDAFEPVRDAIVEAMDVTGLSPEGRADLAVMHNMAEWWCGEKVLHVPCEWIGSGSSRSPAKRDARELPRPLRGYEAASEPGGLWPMINAGRSGRPQDERALRAAYGALLQHGITTVAGLLDAYTPEGDLPVPGIGPKRRVALLHALRSYAAAPLPGATSTNRHEES